MNQRGSVDWLGEDLLLLARTDAAGVRTARYMTCNSRMANATPAKRNPGAQGIGGYRK